MKIFAYGSNMYSRRIRSRISSAKFVTKGYVKQHTIAFHKISKDRSGKADCSFTGRDQDKVWGVVFEIDDNEKTILDNYEGLGRGYNEGTLSVVCGNKTYKAQSYIADFGHIDNSLKPYDWYLGYLIKGAEEFCLPLQYIENVLRKTAATIDPNSKRRLKEYDILNMPINDGLQMGGFTVHEWKLLREKLRRSSDYNSDWDQAVKWFKQRMNRRYLTPLKKISGEFDGAGSTITSVLCILIEHLAAVREGKIHNYLKKGESPKYEYRYSDDFYKKFLGEATIFKGYFYTDVGEPPFCIDDFYKNVRCSLLHEACTKNGWKINVSTNPKQANKIFVRDDDGNKVILRDVLQREIVSYIDSYIEELKGSNELRMNLARKMDNLCELAPDPKNYKWWIEK